MIIYVQTLNIMVIYNIFMITLYQRVLKQQLIFQRQVSHPMLKIQRKLHYSGMIYGALMAHQGRAQSMIMRSTRATYHYAIRYVKRMSETFKKQAMGRAISENNSRELQQEVKKMRKNKRENLTVTIMPSESIILPHYLLTNMKNCITLLDMMNCHSVPLIVKILLILSRSVLYLMLTPIVI